MSQSLFKVILVISEDQITTQSWIWNPLFFLFVCFSSREKNIHPTNEGGAHKERSSHSWARFCQINAVNTLNTYFSSRLFILLSYIMCFRKPIPVLKLSIGSWTFSFISSQMNQSAVKIWTAMPRPVWLQRRSKWTSSLQKHPSRNKPLGQLAPRGKQQVLSGSVC